MWKSLPFIKKRFFSSPIPTDNITNSPTTTNNITNIGITLEKYEERLNNREKRIRKELTQAYDEEKQRLQIALAEIQEKKNNAQQSYDKYIAELKERIEKLENFPTNNPKEFTKAIDALKQGNSDVADNLFAQIEQDNADTIKTVVEATFQRAKIAEEDIRYADALKHYQKAHS